MSKVIAFEWNNPANNIGDMNDKRSYSEMRYSAFGQDGDVFYVDFMGLFDEKGAKLEYDYDYYFHESKNHVRALRVGENSVTCFSEDLSTEYGTFVKSRSRV